MTDETFIAESLGADVRALALGKAPDGVNLRYCLRQIGGRQIAARKLPSWARTEGIVYPVRLSMEQCSSEQTALYKRRLAERLTAESHGRMADLTGGFGIDFSFLAQLFDEAHYVECDGELCRIARHNLPLLGLPQAHVHQTSAEAFLDGAEPCDLIFLDPSRRDAAGRRVVALGDCSPDVEALRDRLLAKARTLLVKLSPMLDIQDTLRRLPGVDEVHVVSVDGECKEILLVASRGKSGTAACHCVNLSARTQTFSTVGWEARPVISPRPGGYLYEPNASILKAGVQDALCEAFRVGKLHPFSHLFTSDRPVPDFPGRSFRVEDVGSFAKRDLRRLLSGIGQCNLAVRNFPAGVGELRRRLKLREGGDTYLFATTLADGSHALLRCSRLRLPLQE